MNYVGRYSYWSLPTYLVIIRNTYMQANKNKKPGRQSGPVDDRKRGPKLCTLHLCSNEEKFNKARFLLSNCLRTPTYSMPIVRFLRHLQTNLIRR